jgi:lycopene cyclase domain-containing protein
MEFLEHHFFYFILMIFSLAYPLAQSFERRINYYSKWSRLLPSIIVMMILFIPWDIWFTDLSVWQFNSDYICGIKFFLLPLEEWLFFIIIPFACVFIHEVLNYFFNKQLDSGSYIKIAYSLACILAYFSVIYSDRLYTLICFSLTSLSLFILAIHKPNWIGTFFRTYFVSLIPFLIINGFLTGSFNETPIVSYSSSQIIGLRILNIPIEDSMYNLLMLLIVISIYERKSTLNRIKNVIFT